MAASGNRSQRLLDLAAEPPVKCWMTSGLIRGHPRGRNTATQRPGEHLAGELGFGGEMF